MSQPESYSEVVKHEWKRWKKSVMKAHTDLASELEETDQLDKAKEILNNVFSMWFDDYVAGGLGEFIALRKVNHKQRASALARRDPDQISKLETFTAAMRALALGVKGSYFFKSFFSSFGLEAFRKRMVTGIEQLLDILKHGESVLDWLEVYMTWLEHGAEQLAEFQNAARDEGEEEVEASELFGDNRVKLYAFLKTVNCDSAKAVQLMGDIHKYLKSVAKVLSLGFKMYASLEPKDIGNLFNMIAANKTGPMSPGSKEFETLQEFNDFFQKKAKDSVDKEDGFVHNLDNLIDAACDKYVEEMLEEIMDNILFFPSVEEQENYIRMFEKGKLCPRQRDERKGSLE